MRLSACKPAGERTARSKNVRVAEAVFAAAVLVLALAGYLVASAAQADAKDGRAVAVVSRDGSVIDEIDLAAVEAPFQLRLEDRRGFNLVDVEPGRIHIAEADCPDQICARTGWIDGPGAPIACVPHGLTIVVEERAASSAGKGSDGVDATSR